jgi:hypothetical protein
MSWNDWHSSTKAATGITELPPGSAHEANRPKLVVVFARSLVRLSLNESGMRIIAERSGFDFGGERAG